MQFTDKIDHSLSAAWLQVFRPPRRQPTVEWAQENIRLGSDSASRGPIRYTKYQRDILDAFDDPTTRHITLCWASQTGKSEILNAAIAHTAAENPAPILAVYPTIDMAKAFARTRLASLIDNCLPFKKAIRASNVQKGGGDQLLTKIFAGGSLSIVPAGVPAQLAQRSVKLVILDEIDRFPTTREGRASQLALKRSTTYLDAKAIIASTPTTRASSEILERYEQGTRERFHLPCPHCLTLAPLEFENLHWDEGKPQDAAYFGQCCGAAWTERDRQTAIDFGEWVSENADADPAHRSFHLSELYSPWSSWAKIAAAFEAANTPAKRQVFENTVLARAYEVSNEMILLDALELEQRAETITHLPKDTLHIAMGGDVQKDRIEISTIAFLPDNRMIVLKHAVIAGDPTLSQVWNDLERHIRGENYPVEGAKHHMAPAIIGIDAGFLTTTVATWVALMRRKSVNVIALKGRAGFGKPALQRVNGSHRGITQIYLVGVDDIRLALQQRLAKDNGQIRFSHMLERGYFRGLTLERLETKTNRQGYPILKWVMSNAGDKKGGNEASDAAIYAIAASVLAPKDTTKTQSKPRQSIREIAAILNAN